MACDLLELVVRFASSTESSFSNQVDFKFLIFQWALFQCLFLADFVFFFFLKKKKSYRPVLFVRVV